MTNNNYSINVKDAFLDELKLTSFEELEARQQEQEKEWEMEFEKSCYKNHSILGLLQRICCKYMMYFKSPKKLIKKLKKSLTRK